MSFGILFVAAPVLILPPFCFVLPPLLMQWLLWGK
jgi:hypothetical protein